MRITLFLCWCVLAPSIVHGQDTLSLDAAVESALAVAPQVRAGTAQLESAQALSVSAGRLPDPELIVGIDNLPVDGPDAWSTTADFMTMRKLGIMQEFPNRKKRDLQQARAEADSAVAAADLNRMRLEVARDAARAWIRVAIAEMSLAELEQLTPEVALQAAAARAAVAAGRGSTSDALAAEVAVAQLGNRALKLRGEVRRARLELARWIGPEAERPPAGLPSFDHLPTPPAALLASVQEHGSLVAFESRAQAAQVDVDLAKAERRPGFSTELAYAKRGPDFSDMVSLEFRVGLPIFSRNRQNPTISARYAELRRLEADREAEVRLHTAELNQMVIDWELAGQQLEKYDKELLPMARERSQAAIASYRSGRGDLPALLDAYAGQIELIIERAELQNERGSAWAYLRYLDARHLDHGGSP